MNNKEQTIMGIILVVALILGLMYFNIIPNLFVINQPTTYNGSCSSVLQDATNGAVGNECYYLDNGKDIMKVNSVQNIESSGITSCQIDVVAVASASECLNNKVYTTQGVKVNITICDNFLYSNWSECVNNQSTRNLIYYSPANCFGGDPILTKSCVTPANNQNNNQVIVYNQPSCSYTYSNWSTCSNNQSTRTVVSSSPANCVGNSVLTKTCAIEVPEKSFLDKYLLWIIGGIVLIILALAFSIK